MITEIGIPTEIVFGPGSLSRFMEIASARDWRRALVVVPADLVELEFAASFLNGLAEGGIETALWTDVEPNPRVATVDRCIAEHKASHVDAVVGMGGGSAMDQTKATAVGLEAEVTVSALMRGEADMPAEKVPLILIPTTSGTGAEVSWGAIMTDSERGVKGGIRGRIVAADHAIVDPNCTLGLPVPLTMRTGFDVLTHATESFLSRKRSEYTTMLSRQAMTTVFEYLPTLQTEPTQLEARTKLAFASMLAGINLALSSTCLPHRLQYPLGALTDTPHAEGLAALYPAWLKSTLPHARAELAEGARWLGLGTNESDEEALATAFVERLLGFMSEIGMERRLSDFGVDETMAAGMVEQVTGNLAADPGDTSPEALRRIYVSSV